MLTGICILPPHTEIVDGLMIAYDLYLTRNPDQQTEQELQRQRSVEVAQLYRQRRHISQDDTLSINSSASETDLSQQQQHEERRVSKTWTTCLLYLDTSFSKFEKHFIDLNVDR